MSKSHPRCLEGRLPESHVFEFVRNIPVRTELSPEHIRSVEPEPIIVRRVMQCRRCGYEYCREAGE